MRPTANDLFGPSAAKAEIKEMRVLELAIFIAVHRAVTPLRLGQIGEQLADWFETPVSAEDVAGPAARMVANQWIAADGDCLKPCEVGRSAARVLVNGIIRMLDHGTRVLDVALMLAVLRLTKGELEA